MTEGGRTGERPSGAVTRIVREGFGLELKEVIDGWAGEESIGWRVKSSGGDRFVQRFPAWRRVADLVWCDDVATAAATSAQACMHAITAGDGRRAIETPDGPVMVFPFVEGTHPEESRPLADDAAELLARIHRGIATSWTGGEGPASRRLPWSEHNELDRRLRDDDLDAWKERAASGDPPRLPIHGDFYSGNLLVRRDRIIGVIDWAEARLEHHDQEVSWAAWEFCHNDAGDDLVDEDAVGFLRRYHDAGGTVDTTTPFDAIPWIRQRLRLEASQWYHDTTPTPVHSDYHEAQVRAFATLRGRRVNG